MNRPLLQRRVPIMRASNRLQRPALRGALMLRGRAVEVDDVDAGLDREPGVPLR